MLVTKNIFGLSAPYYNEFKDSCRTHQHSYNKTQQQLSNFFLNQKYKQLYKTMTNDITIFKSPASQTMIDIYHQSQQSWPDFIQSTSLSHLQKNNIEIFTTFQSYRSQFTSTIHAPIRELLKSKCVLFKHDANDIAITISEIHNLLKTRNIPENTCLQIDAQLNVDLNDSFNNNFDDYDDDSDDDDGDELYEQMTRQFNDRFQHVQKIEKTNNFCNDNEQELAEITNVIRDLLVQLPTNPYSYKQYEMFLDLNQQTIKTRLKKNNIPDCEYLNAPLCRIFNSIKSIDLSNNNMITFSFHAMADCVRIYCYIVYNGTIYGSRIFEKDLLSNGMIPALFEDNKIETFNEIEIHKNMEGKCDVIYEQYKTVLFERSSQDLETIVEENDHCKNKLKNKLIVLNLKRQMSSSTCTSVYMRSDTQSTRGIQTDWSYDELKDEIKQCFEKSSREWNFKMNIDLRQISCSSDSTRSDTQSTRGIPSDWSTSQNDNITSTLRMQQTSDLTAENLKKHEELQILNDDNDQNNDDIFDENSIATMQNAPMPNVYISDENNTIPNFLTRDSNKPLRMQQYNKLDTQMFDRGTVYYNNNILPEMMQRLETLSNRLEQLLQGPQDQRIVINIFENAWNVYFVVCFCLMSYYGFNNLYILIQYLLKRKKKNVT